MIGFLIGCVFGAWLFYALAPDAGDMNFGFALGCTWIVLAVLVWLYVTTRVAKQDEELEENPHDWPAP